MHFPIKTPVLACCSCLRDKPWNHPLQLYLYLYLLLCICIFCFCSCICSRVNCLGNLAQRRVGSFTTHLDAARPLPLPLLSPDSTLDTCHVCRRPRLWLYPCNPLPSPPPLPPPLCITCRRVWSVDMRSDNCNCCCCCWVEFELWNRKNTLFFIYFLFLFMFWFFIYCWPTTWVRPIAWPCQVQPERGRRGRWRGG